MMVYQFYSTMKVQGNKYSSSESASDRAAVQEPNLNHISTKMPKNLLETIRIKNHEGHDPNNSQGQRPMVRKPSLLLRKASGQAHCEICNEDFLMKKMFIADCEHKEMFCESCLQHYSIYKVELFGKVRCPSSGCELELNIQNAFFNSLPLTIQTKYRRIVRSYAAFEDPYVRLCPNQACQGILRLSLSSMSCDACSGQFCRQCLLSFHTGECDSFERQFYEQTLKYRQCPKCLSFIDTFEGDNHMVCQCKHQFCYVCRANWHTNHRNHHDEHGSLIIPAPEANPMNPEARNEPVVEQQQQKFQCYKRQPTLCFYLTIIPRVILFLILMSLVVALFGVLVVVTVLALPLMGKKKNRSRPDTNLEKEMRRKEDECLQKMCSGYFSLYGIVTQNLLCP